MRGKRRVLFATQNKQNSFSNVYCQAPVTHRRLPEHFSAFLLTSAARQLRSIRLCSAYFQYSRGNSAKPTFCAWFRNFVASKELKCFSGIKSYKRNSWAIYGRKGNFFEFAILLLVQLCTYFKYYSGMFCQRFSIRRKQFVNFKLLLHKYFCWIM